MRMRRSYVRTQRMPRRHFFWKYWKAFDETKFGLSIQCHCRKQDTLKWFRSASPCWLWSVGCGEEGLVRMGCGVVWGKRCSGNERLTQESTIIYHSTEAMRVAKFQPLWCCELCFLLLSAFVRLRMCLHVCLTVFLSICVSVSMFVAMYLPLPWSLSV